MRAHRIRIDYGKTVPGDVSIIDTKLPHFSWAVNGVGTSQTGFRLKVLMGDEGIWDTGWCNSTAQSARYGGPELEPGEIYEVLVFVRDETNEAANPARAFFCLGSLDEWKAPWLCEEEPAQDAVISFIKDFDIAEEIVSACLFICGLGYHKVMLNGEHIFNLPMNPATSQYDERSYYTVLPGLEKRLQKGRNRLGVRVAAGWRDPNNVCYQLVNGRIPAFTGKTQMSAMLRLRNKKGEVTWLYSDEEWPYYYGEVTKSNIFDGERYEAARFIKDWSKPGVPIPALAKPRLTEAPGKRIVPQALEPVKEQEIYPARLVSSVAEKIYSVDFGQNIAGVCRIRIPRDIPSGQVIEMYHMEFLDEDARLYLPQLRNAKCIDTYIAAGNGRDPEYWQPEFTYHGFRYAEVKGYPEPLLKEDIQAVSVYSDVASNSFFTCGNALVNQINKMALQTEKANIHSILTDCPQRDERMAWLNDATVRFESTPYNFDVGRLFPKVVRDCMDVQDTEGCITCTAPFAFGARPADPVCSAYLIAGWQAWLHTGNDDILKEAYDGFAAWNQFLESKSEGFIVTYSYYGDWAAPAYACQSEEFAVSAVTPGILMSTGYFYYNTCLLARMAKIIGRKEDALLQDKKAEQIRQAFLEKWWDAATGSVGTGSQGCQSFALWLNILPEEGRQKAADYLHQDLIKHDFRFTTGNLCTRYMMDVLTRFGYIEDAWQLATREEYPSIGFMLQNEATTVWERFELKKNPTMNSHNHPMYGAVSYWYNAYLAGIKPTNAGFKEFSVKPYLPEKLLSASAAVETPYGDVSVRWVKRYGEIHLYLDVPHGTKAHVSFPWGGEETVLPGFHHWDGLNVLKESRDV